MKIMIIGCGGHGREMSLLVDRMDKSGLDVKLAGFVDDDPGLQGKKICQKPVTGDIKWALQNLDEFHFVCAIGNQSSRSVIVERLDKADGMT